MTFGGGAYLIFLILDAAKEGGGDRLVFAHFGSGGCLVMRQGSRLLGKCAQGAERLKQSRIAEFFSGERGFSSKHLRTKSSTLYFVAKVPAEL